MMRDPARIDAILGKLKTLWLLVPDQRLGQLITNIASRPTSTLLWHLEDDEWEDLIDKRIKDWKK